MAAISRDIAEADGFTYVLEKGAGIVYAPAALDLTNELIRKYNAKYPGGAKKAEAAAPKKGAEPAAKKADAAPKK
jgi:outer membrane protein